MSDDPEHESHHRPHTSPMAAPFLDFDLPADVHRLHAEATWSTGQNARTLITFDNFRVVLTALQANVRIPEHKTEGLISVHVLSGHIQLKAAGRTFSLRSGGLLALDHGRPGGRAYGPRQIERPSRGFPDDEAKRDHVFHRMAPAPSDTDRLMAGRNRQMSDVS